MQHSLYTTTGLDLALKSAALENFPSLTSLHNIWQMNIHQHQKSEDKNLPKYVYTHTKLRCKL